MTNYSDGHISLVEAVETLSHIADLNMGKAIEIFEQPKGDKPDWEEENNAETSKKIKEIFNVILNYLRNFYKNEYLTIKDNKTLEGIKAVMVLVAEAAKKIDKLHNEDPKKESVLESKEYKKLQDFYLRKISRTIDEGTLGKWILALTKNAINRRRETSNIDLETKHLIIDLETVKKDTEYELFLLRKEDGGRFFNPRLIRNMKLVSDFGHYFHEEKNTNSLNDLALWKERYLNNLAKVIYKNLEPIINQFYKHNLNNFKNEPASLLQKCFMALMLAHSSHSFGSGDMKKTSSDYFSDAFDFLKKVLVNRDYQKMLSSFSDEPNEEMLLNCIFATAKCFINSNSSFSNLSPFISNLITEGLDLKHVESKSKNHISTLGGRISNDFHALNRLIKLHPHGPITKTIQSFEEGNCNYFDPIDALNLPTTAFELSINNFNIEFVRLPSPTMQEYIHKASISPLIQGGLEKNSLIINLQDRSAATCVARTKAVENLNLPFVSIGCDNEFYQQIESYKEINQAGAFTKQLKSFLLSGSCKWPDELEDELSLFADDAIHFVHHLFFSQKNVLTRTERLAFIDLVLMFVELKVIDQTKPKVVYFVCKDGVDKSPACIALLKSFFMFLDQSVKKEQIDALETELFCPALLIRERMILSEVFHHFESAFKHIEETHDQGHDVYIAALKEFFDAHFQLPWIT